jgi:hypothetical protein
MLQRQQAQAVLAARAKIVEGAVTMVESALDRLEREDVVKLNDDRKAAMCQTCWWCSALILGRCRRSTPGREGRQALTMH